MIKAFSFLFIGFVLLLAIPLCLGIAGGIFGLIFGIIGAVFGLFFGLIGFILKSIAWMVSSIFHLLFGWNSDFGFHSWHCHFNGYLFAALIVLIIAVALKKK